MAAEILGPAWNISQKGEEIITENNTVKDKTTILKNALNSDLKETGSPTLNKIQNKNNISQIVLQIQKITNVSAPKANQNSQAAPRMLRLVLTDGDSYIQAIEITSIPTLHHDKTPPGSKLLIISAKVSSGYLLLHPSSCSLLGGQVPSLYEKWELAKSVRNHARQNTSSDGPPAWVNFGYKIQNDIQDKSFKSLESKNQESKENSKFELQRQDAIAEATSGAVKKVFGGGVKQPVQPPTPKYKKPNDFPNKEKKNYKNKPIMGVDVEEKPQKPSERVSLFDFLEDKLPNDPEPVKSFVNNNPVRTFNPVKSYPNNNPRNVHNNQQNYKNRNPRFDQNVNPRPFDHANPRPFDHGNPRPFDQGNPRPFDHGNPRPFDHGNPRPFDHANPRPGNQMPQNNEEINGLSNNFGKMSVNSQFASRSLKQHLNLGPQKQNNVESVEVPWKVGDDCVAKYWEDGKFYNANITAITDSTCVVKFKGYGNLEEVLKTDCLPVVKNDPNRKSHTGPMEFRRSSRTYRRQ